MHNSSGELGDGDSISSFGGNHPRSEGGRRPRTTGSLTQHTSPIARGDEENKEAGNSSSDTANFFRNSEQLANLSFDNDSIIGAPVNPIISARGATSVENDSDVINNAEGGAEPSMSSSLAPSRIIPNPHLVLPRLNNAIPINSGTESRDGPEDQDESGTSSLINSHRSTPRAGEHPNDNIFEQQLDETVEDLMRLINTESSRLRETKTLLREQTHSFEDFHGCERANLRREQALWDSNAKKVRELYSPVEDIIPLNIGGTHKIITTRSTLVKVPGSNLAAMFRVRRKTENSRIFLDRDGDAFCMMLSYLRNGKMPVFESRIQEDAFYKELEHWQIPINRPDPARINAFDPHWCADTLHLENSNLLVRKNGPQHGVVFSRLPLDESNPRIEFRVVSGVPSIQTRGKSSLFIGVADRSKYQSGQLVSTFWKDSPSSYYWDVWNDKLIAIDDHGGQRGVATGYGCGCHSYEEMRIGVSFDPKKSTLSFTKDGISQGVAFSNVPGGFYPAVDLWLETGYVEVAITYSDPISCCN